MTKVTGSMGRPIQGISQQPPQVRAKGQLTEMLNSRPDVVDGAIPRPSTWFGKRLKASFPALTKFYDYDRGDDESYLMALEPDGTLNIFDIEGNEQIVNIDSDVVSYMTNSDPRSNIKMLTISDFTFLLNTTKVVAESSSNTTANSNTAIVYVKFMDYQQRQQIFINGNSRASYISPDGSVTEHLALVAPAHVAGHLKTDLENNLGGSWTIIQEDSCLFISRDDGADFSIYTEDEVGGANLVALKDTISSTADLSPKAPEDFIIKIEPAGTSSIDNASYWLKAEDTNSDNITWRETIAPSISVGLNKATMPIQIVREAISNGIATFEVTRGDWKDRDVGDDRTNPQPSFVGFRISAMGLVQNRFYFTSGENWVTSVSNDFFKFYRNSAQTSLDSDPIDGYADSSQINALDASIQYDGDTILFSENAQFMVRGDIVLTADNAVPSMVTSFESYLGVKPVAGGESIFFAYEYGQFCGIREFFTDSVTDTKRARPVTEHVNQLMLGLPLIMQSSTSVDSLLITVDSDESIIYVYEWLWQGQEKAQSAWHKWSFGGDKVLYYFFDRSQLYLVIERPDGVFMESLDFGNPTPSELPYSPSLDRKVSVVLEWSEDDGGYWYTTDIYPDYAIEDLVFILDGTDQSGAKLDGRKEDGLIKFNPIDTSARSTLNTIGGIRFRQKIDPTVPVPKDGNGDPTDPSDLTVSQMDFEYISTGDVTFTVTDSFNRERSVVKGNRRLNYSNNLVGYDPLIAGTHKVGIRKRSDKFTISIISEDHRPFVLRDIQFSGNQKNSGRRVTI